MSRPTPQRSAVLPGWAKVLLGLALVVVIGLITIEILDMAAAARWRRYAAQLRAAGEPLTFEEIEAVRTNLPDDRNGAKIIERLWEDLQGVGQDADDWVLVFGPRARKTDAFAGIPRHTIEPSRIFLAQQRALLKRLAALRDVPVGRLSLPEVENPFENLLPDLSSQRTAGKLEHLDALMRLVDGDLAGAAEAARLQFHIAGTLNEHPTLIGRLVQMAIDEIAVKTVELTLRAGVLDDPSLSRVAQAVDARLASNTMRWAYRGERAFWIEVCDQLATGRLPFSDVVSHYRGWSDSLRLAPEVLFRRNQLVGTQLLSRLVEVCDDPRALIEATARNDEEVSKSSRGLLIVRALIPSLSLSAVLHARITAQLECTRVALAAERLRLKTGRLPGSIDELVPEYLDAVPLDPFDGKPLRLATTDEGIVIYSVGDDSVDDGGRVTRGEGQREPRDLGFRLLQPEQRGLVIINEPPPDYDGS